MIFSSFNCDFLFLLVSVRCQVRTCIEPIACGRWPEIITSYRRYRTYSHFGFRIPTQMILPMHFHYPNQPFLNPLYRNIWLSTPSKSWQFFSTDDFNDLYRDDQMPAIKCSLCKCSTPHRRSANQYQHKFYDAGFASKSNDECDVSCISDVSSDDTRPNQAKPFTNRLVVRVVAKPAWKQLIRSVNDPIFFLWFMLKMATCLKQVWFFVVFL